MDHSLNDDGKETPMTATLEATEAKISQPETSDLYMCRRSELVLTMEPRYPIMGASGQKVGEHPGKRLAFRDGVLRVPKKGTMPLEDGRPAPVEEVRDFLARHRLKDDLSEGFWHVDPVAPPVSQDETALLMRAAMRLDTDTLRSIITAEQAGWNRPGVIGPAEDSLREIEAALAAQAETAKAKPAK